MTLSLSSKMYPRLIRTLSTTRLRLADKPRDTIRFPKVVDVKDLSEEQKKSLEKKAEDAEETPKFTKQQLEQIQNISSSLYTPQMPTETKNAELIRQRIASIERRLDAQKRREEEKLRILQERQAELLRPQLRDFRRPIASFLMLAMSVYMGLQYWWYTLEAETHVEKKENETREYERQIQALLDEQTEIAQKPEKKPSWWHRFL